MEQSLTSGQLARVTGVPAKTIRYEQLDILPAAQRSTSRYRQYFRHYVDAVQRIRAYASMVPSLTTIASPLMAAEASCWLLTVTDRPITLGRPISYPCSTNRS